MNGARSRRGRAAVLTAALLATLAGCSGDEPEQPALVVTSPGNVSTWGFHPSPGNVLLLGTSPMRVLRPVTLESATMAVESGRLDLLEARVSLFSCPGCRPRPGLVGYPGHAGSRCSTGPWPPAGYGPSYPVDGFELAPGDRPSFLFYLRPGSPAARSGPITLTYRENGERRHATVTNERVAVDPPDGLPHPCADSLWFGADDDPDSRLVRSMTPRPSGSTPAGGRPASPSAAGTP